MPLLGFPTNRFASDGCMRNLEACLFKIPNSDTLADRVFFNGNKMKHTSGFEIANFDVSLALAGLIFGLPHTSASERIRPHRQLR